MILKRKSGIRIAEQQMVIIMGKTNNQYFIYSTRDDYRSWLEFKQKLLKACETCPRYKNSDPVFNQDY